MFHGLFLTKNSIVTIRERRGNTDPLSSHDYGNKYNTLWCELSISIVSTNNLRGLRRKKQMQFSIEDVFFERFKKILHFLGKTDPVVMPPIYKIHDYMVILITV